MNERDFIKLYRKQVEDRKEVPPDSCWDDIRTQLDIDETWDGISAELDRILPVRRAERKKIVFFIRVAAIAASLALLMLLFSPLWRQVDDNSDVISGLNGDGGSGMQTIPESLSGMTNTGEPLMINSEAPDIRDNSFNANPSARIPIIPQLTDGTSVADINLEQDAVNVLQHRIAANYNVTVSSGMAGNPSLMAVSPSVVSAPLISGQNSEHSDRRRFYAGISLSGRNTWLLSEETFNGLNKHNFNSTKVNIINDVGLTLRYSSGPGWSFEGSGFISSKNEQSYSQYINGVYSDKSYVLRYSSLELTASRMIRRPSALKPSAVITAGAYVSYLHSAHKVLNSSAFNISDQYKPFDYGIIIGSGIDIPVKGNFILAPGLRFRYGFPNIFAGQDALPGSLNITRNASVEFRMNIMVPFKKM